MKFDSIIYIYIYYIHIIYFYTYIHHWLFVNITFWSLLNFSIIHLSKRRGPAPIENVGNHCGWSWKPGISGTSSRSHRLKKSSKKNSESGLQQFETLGDP